MCINLIYCNFLFVTWVSSRQCYSASNMFQVGHSHSTCHDTFGHILCFHSLTHSLQSSFLCSNFIMTLMLSFIMWLCLNKLMPLLMCLLSFFPSSDTGYPSCCFLLTCSFILVDKFHFHLFCCFPFKMCLRYKLQFSSLAVGLHPNITKCHIF